MSFVWDGQDAVCLVATATKLGSRHLGSSCWCLLLPLPLSQHDRQAVSRVRSSCKHSCRRSHRGSTPGTA